MEKKESIPEMMHAWAVVKPGPIDGEQSPLQFVLKPVPKPKRGEVLAKIHSALSLASGSGFPGFGMHVGFAAFVVRVAKTFAPIHATQAGITMAAMLNMSRYQKDLPIESPRVSMT